MRTILLSILIVAASLSAYAQSSNQTPPVTESVFTVVEVMPEYPGGQEAMVKLIKDNLVYPKHSFKHEIQGRVVVEFVVDVDGSVTDITIVKSVAPDIDAEAIRLVKLFPKFKPGSQQGKKVKVKFNLPLIFKLT